MRRPVENGKDVLEQGLERAGIGVGRLGLLRGLVAVGERVCLAGRALPFRGGR